MPFRFTVHSTTQCIYREVKDNVYIVRYNTHLHNWPELAYINFHIVLIKFDFERRGECCL